jgi:hypothetical protein
MIRIIRVLEYTFENQEDADEHISRMYVPLNGHIKIRRRDHGMTMRSSCIIDLSNTVEYEKENDFDD